MTPDKEILSWQRFGDAVDDLARKVVDDGFEPDLVVAIARGGLALGMSLGYKLDVKNLFTVNVEFYTGVDERLDVPILLPPVPDAIDLAGLQVLIVDDIADTGLTLQHVQQFCAGHVADARTAVIFEKERSVVKPDYVWKRTEAWIEFPWDGEPLRRRPSRA